NSLTYTFATGALSGSLDGWSQSIPAANGNPLYVTAATASSSGATDTIAPNEWASPIILAQDGSDGAAGRNTATIYLFRRAASAPAVPDNSVTYTFATGAISGSLDGWSRTVPEHDGYPLWVTTATAISAGATDTIGPSEWATPQIQAQDGRDSK